MRWLKFIFAAVFAVVMMVAGLMAAAGVVAGGILIFIVHRLLRPARKTLPAQPASTGRIHERATNSSDVIEVTATEVPADPPTR